MTNTQQADSTQSKLFDSYFVLSLCLSIFAVAPLLHPNTFQTHGGLLPIWSVNSLREDWLNMGWLPVLTPFNPWRSGGLLPYYLAAMVPLSALWATKLISIVGILAGSSGLYLWLRSWVGPHGATVAALIYTYAPFNIATLYVRGAWSEAFFWGILPWALLAATFLVAQPKPLIMGIAVVFWTALGLSQLGLSVWAFILISGMTLLFHRPQAFHVLVSASVGVILAALITFPRLNQALTPSEFPPDQHLVYPSQLLSAFWGYGLSQPGWDDGITFSLGIAALSMALLAVFIWRGGPDKRAYVFLGIAIVPVLLSLPWSRWFWSIPGVDHLLTYPWQLLGFSGLGLAVVAAIGFWLNDRLSQPPIFAAVLIFILLPMYPNLAPQYTLVDISDDPLAIYGQNEIVLLSTRFYIDNPAADEETTLSADEAFIDITPDMTFRPNTKIYLDVAWQAIKPIPKNYKTFAHMVDDQNELVHQNDAFPQLGARPTDTWLPGEIIEDTYTFRLPGRRTTNPATVWLGFYEEETFIRLPALGDDEGRAFLNVR